MGLKKVSGWWPNAMCLWRKRDLLTEKLVINLFISDLINDAISSSNYISSNDRILLNNALTMTWKEA
jgi:hypothetical protein